MESLDTPLVEMFVLSIYYWLTKFVQEVAKPSKERYPPKTLYGIISGIRLFLAEQKPSEDITPLNTSDKRYDLTDDFKQGTHVHEGRRKQVLGNGTLSSCEFMSCPYLNNCTISINVNGVAKNE